MRLSISLLQLNRPSEDTGMFVSISFVTLNLIDNDLGYPLDGSIRG